MDIVPRWQGHERGDTATMTDIIKHTAESPAYWKQNDEPADKYELFTEWCRIPVSSRSLPNFCRRTSIPPRMAKKMIEQWQWETRAASFDNDAMQLRPDPRTMDEEAALAGQLAAAQILLDLGISSIQLKNPALLSADKAMKLVEKGVEIQRRAMGQADLNVQFTVDDMSRVNRLMDDLFDVEDAEEVEEIEDGDDGPEAIIPI
jgi:hypothetical protein